MDPISFSIAILGLSVTIYIAWKQNLRANKAEANLKELVESQSEIIANQLKNIIQGMEFEDQQGELGGRPNKVSFEDVTGDGQNELLVQYPGGAHGSQLKVFGWNEWAEFVEIGSLGVGTPVGFKVYDFDGDNINEIITEETNWESGKPYVTAPRIQKVYKWKDNSFIEVS